MPPAYVSVVTIGVRDLQRMRAFYAALGWEIAVDMEEFVAYETRGAVLTLYLLDKLSADSNVVVAGRERSIGGFNLAINVDRIEQVDESVETARAAGAEITKEPYTADWGGRTAYFLDPEDNLWEIAWVPPDSIVGGLVRRGRGDD